MSYIPVLFPVRLTEDDVSELKSLLESLEQAEFQERGNTRATTSLRSRQHLKSALTRILDQLPRI